MPADLAVIGLGHLGLPLAQAAVAAGIPTLGVQRPAPSAGSLTAAELRRMLSGGFRPATDPAELGRVRTAVICAPTPRGADGTLDLSQVEAAARTLAARLRPHTTVILESPVHPGTTEEFLRPLLEEGSGLRAGRDFHLAYSPSRVDPGNRDFTPANTPKVIGGLTPACTESAAAFYGRLTDKVVRARGPREAETVKLLETNFRHVNIALVNEMAVLCHDLGVDLWDVIRCAETKPFGFQAFRPGPGVGGHGGPPGPARPHTRPHPAARCAWWNSPSRSTTTCRSTSSSAPPPSSTSTASRPAAPACCSSASPTSRTSPTNRAPPPSEIAIRLMELGASVSYHDPHIPSWSVLDRPVPRADSLYEAAADADLTILLQQHRTYDLQGLSVKAQLLLDTRGATPTGAAHRL